MEFRFAAEMSNRGIDVLWFILILCKFDVEYKYKIDIEYKYKIDILIIDTVLAI